MTRREKLKGRAAKLERTQEAFMDAIRRLLAVGRWYELPPATWKINFGPPHCSSLGPSRRRERESRPGMIHTVRLPESWLEDVYAQDLAVIGDVMVLATAKARCDFEGVEAWAAIVMTGAGRKVRPVSDLYIVRFGGHTVMASAIDVAFRDIQDAIRVELGLAEVPLPF